MLLLVLCGLAVWYLVAAPQSQLLGPAFARGSAHSGAVALTFDDGPGEDTPVILDLLRQHGAVATFFLCGSNVQRYPEIARRIVLEGHEIGNHTYSHPRLLAKTPGRIALEIDRAQRAIAHWTGCRPNLFRPPYGLRWFGLFPILKSRGFTAVMWSVNGLDWRTPAQHIAARVLEQSRPGAIILLHDGVPPGEPGRRRETVAALPQIIKGLQARFRLVTVSELQGAFGPHQASPQGEDIHGVTV